MAHGAPSAAPPPNRSAATRPNARHTPTNPSQAWGDRRGHHRWSGAAYGSTPPAPRVLRIADATALRAALDPGASVDPAAGSTAGHGLPSPHAPPQLTRSRTRESEINNQPAWNPRAHTFPNGVAPAGREMRQGGVFSCRWVSTRTSRSGCET